MSIGEMGAERPEPKIDQRRRDILREFIADASFYSEGINHAVTKKDWGPGGETITEREDEIGRRLIALGLPNAEWADNQQINFPEFPCKKDVEKREAAFREAGLDDEQNTIVGHNFILGKGSPKLRNIFIYELVHRPNFEEMRTSRNTRFDERVDGGTLLLGKVIYNDTNHPDKVGATRFAPLSEQEKGDLEALLNDLENRKEK